MEKETKKKERDKRMTFCEFTSSDIGGNDFRILINMDYIAYIAEGKTGEVYLWTLNPDDTRFAVKESFSEVKQMLMGANKEREVYKTAVTLPLAGGTTARWERDGHHIRCSLCGMLMCDTDREGDPIPSNFCPSCGADMRES